MQRATRPHQNVKQTKSGLGHANSPHFQWLDTVAGAGVSASCLTVDGGDGERQMHLEMPDLTPRDVRTRENVSVKQ